MWIYIGSVVWMKLEYKEGQDDGKLTVRMYESEVEGERGRR